MKPCTILNTGKHYSFYVKREVEGKGCENSFSWNGARWLSEDKGSIESTMNSYLSEGCCTIEWTSVWVCDIKTHRIPNRRD